MPVANPARAASIDGAKVRALREAAGLSREALAQAINAFREPDQQALRSTAIEKIEVGDVYDPAWSTVRDIARALKVDPRELDAA